MSNRLTAFARRASGDPFFLGFALSAYARSERLDEHALAERLGCSVETLVPLRICRRPAGDAAAFRADVAAIAARFGVHREALAEMVRRSDVLGAMREVGAQEAGTLRAARDREPPDEGEPR